MTKTCFLLLWVVIIFVIFYIFIDNNIQEIKSYIINSSSITITDLNIKKYKTVNNKEFNITKLKINECQFLLINRKINEYNNCLFLIHDPNCIKCNNINPPYMSVNPNMTRADIHRILEYNRELYEIKLKTQTKIQTKD